MYVCFVYMCIIKKKRSDKKKRKERKENLETWLLFSCYRFSSILLKNYYRFITYYGFDDSQAKILQTEALLPRFSLSLSFSPLPFVSL